jgi:hypothetical protein
MSRMVQPPTPVTAPRNAAMICRRIVLGLVPYASGALLCVFNGYWIMASRRARVDLRHEPVGVDEVRRTESVV